MQAAIDCAVSDDRSPGQTDPMTVLSGFFLVLAASMLRASAAGISSLEIPHSDVADASVVLDSLEDPSAGQLEKTSLQRGRSRSLLASDAGEQPKEARLLSSSAGIPPIFHQVFLTADPEKEPHDKPVSIATFNPEWREHCKELHPEWEYRLWDNAAAEELVRTHYPEFLPTWESYDRRVLRGDAIRPMIMHTFGGLYLDLDTECYRPVDDFLEGHSLVFQADRADDADSINNGIMASSAGHPFWEGVLALLTERAPVLDLGAGNMKVKEGDWQTNVIWRVGPQLLQDAWKEYKTTAALELYARGPHKGSFSYLRTHKNRHVRRHFKVYQVGELYFPCNWKNPEYCLEIADMVLKPVHIAGWHHFTGSWRGG